jgi:hypothetical protein
VTLACIDVDHFKQINDRFGHGVGDRMSPRGGRITRIPTSSHVGPRQTLPAERLAPCRLPRLTW